MDPRQLLTPQQELRQNIDPMVARHWDAKIRAGIVPTEILQQGPVDKDRHLEESKKLAEFKVTAILPLIQSIAARPPDSTNLRFRQIHYFGIGSAGALEAVTKTANSLRVAVTAYDICKTGCKNGRKVFKELEEKGTTPSTVMNRVRQADIEYACEERFIDPGSSCLLVAARVLDVLNISPETRPHRTQELSLSQLQGTKMARTAEKLGKLLRFLKVFLVHPEPENNKNAVWGDSTPCSLEVISGFMARSLEAPVKLRRLGSTSYYGHIYTAALFEK